MKLIPNAPEGSSPFEIGQWDCKHGNMFLPPKNAYVQYLKGFCFQLYGGVAQ